MSKRNRLRWKGKQKQWLKSFLAMMAVFTMLCTSMPITMLANPVSYTVYVGGAEMTVNSDGSNASYYVNGADGTQGTVSAEEPQTGWNAKLYYDITAECVVLEADGLVAKNDHTQNKPAIDSASDVPMKLVLKNNPSIIGGGESVLNKSTYALCCGGDLTIDIQVSGAQFQGVDVTTQQSSGQGSYAIYSVGNITINSADSAYELTAVSGKGSGRSCGIYASQTLTMNGGTIYATAGGDATGYNEGIHGYNIIINAGTVLYAKGSTSGYRSYGIYAGKNMTVNDGAKVYAEGGGDASITSAAGLATGDFGNFTIQGGIFEAVGKEAKYCYGIEDGSMGGNSVIRGGSVKISSEGGTDRNYAVYSKIYLVGGTVVLSCDNTATSIQLASSIMFSDAEQTNDTWYKWTTTDGGSMTKSEDQNYILDTSHTYLRIEKDVPHIHTICGADTCSLDHDKDGVTDAHSGIEFIPWNGTDTDNSTDGRQLTSGNYYLSSDVTIDSTVMIKGTVNLCLNGYALKYENENTKGSVIQVNAGATLNLCDCNGSNSSHVITAPITGEAVTITGGLITGGTGIKYSNEYVGGGIYVLGTMSDKVVTAGIVNQYGGTIAGNITGRGGGVSVIDGEYAMFGGRIAYNQSSQGGGGVYIYGTNSDSSEDRYPAEFCMYGDSRIDYNKAKDYAGGGIDNAGWAVVRMEEDSMITENWSVYEGAGIYLGSSPAGLSLSGNAKVTNNYSDYTEKSAGIYVLWSNYNNDYDFKVSDNVQITGNTAGWKNEIKRDANVEIRISTKEDLPCICVDGSLGENALIPLTIKKSDNIVTDVFSSGGAGNYVENFESEAEGYFIDVDQTSNELKFVSYQIIDEPSDENDYKIAVNYETGAQYTWHEVTIEEITNATSGVTVAGTASYDADGWWTGYAECDEWTLEYFTIPLNKDDMVQIEINHTMDEGQIGMVGEEQVWDFDTSDLYSSLIASQDGNYTVTVDGNDEDNPTKLKVKVSHLGEALSSQTNQLSGATSGKVYICKVTYADGAVLLSEPFTYIETLSGVTAENVTVTYDGQPHSIDVTAPEGATIMYRMNENEAYSVTKPVFVNAGNYTVYYKVSKENYEDYVGEATIIIEKAPLTIKAKDDTILYGEEVPVYAVTYHGFVEGEDETDLIGTLNITCDYSILEDAGDYTITPSGYNSNNYEITYETGILTVNKQQRSVSPENLEAVAETILGKGDGKITGLTTEMEYSTSENGPFTKVTNANMSFAADIYYVRYAESENYLASESVQVVVPNGSAVQITIPDNPKFDVSYDKTQLGWHEDVTITLTPKEGYSLSSNLEVKVNDTEVTVDIQENQKAVFTVEDLEGDIYIEVAGIVDTSAPTIKIAIAENEWNRFWNDLTFGILFNETQTVTITAQDTGSGIDKIFYYMSEEVLTYTEVEDLNDWNEYKKAFDINPENEFIIYVKAVDKEGNTSYINSDNLILLIPGNYEDVTPDTNVGSAKLDADIEELKQDIPFTQNELEMVNMGADVDIWLEVVDISETVLDADKELIRGKLGDNQIGMYIDVSMFKQVGTNPAEKLTQLNDKISITFEVPQELILDSATHTRSYQIMRVHAGIAEILETQYDTEKKMLTFETDCFSTYAILYKDEVVNDTPNNPSGEQPPVQQPPVQQPSAVQSPVNQPSAVQPSSPMEQPSVENPVTSPKTADSDFSLWIALLFVSSGVMYKCVKGKKKMKKYFE